MPTSWYPPYEEQIRDALAADKPDDVLAAQFFWVPVDARSDFLTRYETGTDDPALLIQRFAEAAEAYWNEDREQRDRVRDRLRRIWRLLR